MVFGRMIKTIPMAYVLDYASAPPLRCPSLRFLRHHPPPIGLLGVNRWPTEGHPLAGKTNARHLTTGH